MNGAMQCGPVHPSIPQGERGVFLGIFLTELLRFR